MKTLRIFNPLLYISQLLKLALMVLIIAPAQIYAANYPLEIIQPRAGLSTTNRFYKAFPGLEYNVRMAVIGGAYPFQYSLTTAPSGMTINKESGEISWPNPTASATPYNVAARVLDSEGTAQTVSWTILVTTSGFKFIDAVNGKLASQGGTGSISNPWKSLVDMYQGTDYASKRANSYAGEFLYFKNGTYPTSDLYLEDTYYSPIVEDKKPQVWLAYPGNSPVINVISTIYIYSGGSNLYFDGLTFTARNSTRKIGIRIASGASNVTFRRNTFDGENMVGTTGSNAALLFIENDGKGNFWSIQDNIGQNVTGDGYWLLGYSANKVLVENNTITNISGHSIGPKLNISNWHIRGNRITEGIGNGINVMYYATSSDIDISYNFVKMTSGYGIQLNQENVATGSSVYVYRNTIQGDVRVSTVTSTNGPFTIYKNVFVNNTTGDKISKTNIIYANRLIINDNLAGVPTGSIIDSSGNLTSQYSNYVGTHGYQTTSTATQPIVPPEAPKPIGLNIIIK